MNLVVKPPSGTDCGISRPKRSSADVVGDRLTLVQQRPRHFSTIDATTVFPRPGEPSKMVMAPEAITVKTASAMSTALGVHKIAVFNSSSDASGET
jgi:hypothetical protein